MSFRDQVTTELALRLVADQFPQWRNLSVVPVPVSGWDNKTFRLGEQLVLRLPSDVGYAAAVAKEQEWLPLLAPLLPLPIPEPVDVGAPTDHYPFAWSVIRWLDGQTVLANPPDDLIALAEDLAAFLNALRASPAQGAPPAGEHSFHRGGSLAHYREGALQAFDLLAERIDVAAARAVLDDALATSWTRPPVWLHGDIAPGNLLVADGRLSAVIDFGQACVGDPACDLAIGFTLFSGDSRTAWREANGLDDDTWARGRGWALWKAAILLKNDPSDTIAARTIDDAITDLDS